MLTEEAHALVNFKGYYEFAQMDASWKDGIHGFAGLCDEVLEWNAYRQLVW